MNVMSPGYGELRSSAESAFSNTEEVLVAGFQVWFAFETCFIIVKYFCTSPVRKTQFYTSILFHNLMTIWSSGDQAALQQ